jgi:hypothetical protein
MDSRWINVPENNADAFTKNLDGPAFGKCIKTLVGRDVHMKISPTSEQEGCQEESQDRRFAECKPILYFLVEAHFNRSEIDYI